MGDYDHDQPHPLDRLTGRELEILLLIADGLSNQDIADRLFITLGTVKGYVKQIFSKLNVGSRTQAVAAARATGLLEARLPSPNAIAPKHNLPYQSTPFVGRSAELAAIDLRLAEPGCRLLTLIGPGGIGKTRLAVEAASRQLRHFGDGVYFVSLASVVSSQFLVSSIGDALNLSFFKQSDPKTQLLKALRDKAVFLVMDNFEHVLDGASLLSDILGHAARVKILTTSRERLNLQEEWLFQVQGMRFPTRHEVHDDADIEQMDAIQLFMRQARRVQPAFSLTEKVNRNAVIHTCQLVEGMPLGIELAAALLRAIPAAQLAERITHDSDFLAASTRNVPERHRSVHALFEHSWNLLQPTDRNVFMKLAVFRGGFDLNAAQQVAGASIAAVVTLIDKSLVRPEREGRYDVHELLRQYAYDKLVKSGQADTTRNAHLDYYLGFARNARPMLEHPEMGAWLQRLDREHDNFRAALHWSVESGAVESGLNLGAALGLFWFLQGYLAEGRTHLAEILSAESQGGLPTPARAEALNSAAMLARYQGDYEQARALTSESLRLYRQLEHKHGIADALANLGFVALYQGDMDSMRSLYGESLAINRELGNHQGMADSLSHLALAAFYAGDYATARTLDAESLALWRDVGDKQGIAWALHRLGNVILAEGNVAHAHSVFAESLAMSKELAFQWGLAWSLEDFARLAALKEHDVLALHLGGAAHALRESIGLPLPQPEQAELEHKLDSARQALGSEKTVTAWRDGQSMSVDQALALAEIAEMLAT
jgi:predicted ATPase/DNA-binding CsgD family transcriptional regulator